MKNKHFTSSGGISSKPSGSVQRRALLKGGAAALAFGALAPGVESDAMAAPASPSPSRTPLLARDGEAVVATREIGRAHV